MKREIIDLKFDPSVNGQLGLDVLTIEERYKIHNRDYPGQSPPKRLDFYALMYVTEGSGHHLVDFIPYEIEPDTLIIISKNQVHQFSPKQSYGGYLIIFQEDMLHRALLNFDTTIASFLLDPMNSFVYTIKNAKSLAPDINRLIEEYQKGPLDSVRLPIICHELGVVLFKTARLGKQRPTEIQQNEFPPSLIDFSSLLERHYAARWTAGEYCRELSISTKTLGRLTRKHLRRSPREVIDQRLLLEIKRLLAHSNLSVKEIAFQLGFEDPSNLNKFFKRRQGQTPQNFRQEIRSSI